MTMSVEEKIMAGVYDIGKIEKPMEHPGKALAKRAVELEAYRKKCGDLDRQFWQDCAIEFGIENYPKLKEVEDYVRNHSDYSGCKGWYNCYCEVVNILP